MKILFITSSSINGGAQKHIREMFRSLTDLGNDVYIVAPNGWLLDELRKYKDKLYPLETKVRYIKKLEKILYELKPDIINTFILSGGCFGVAAWKRGKFGKIFITVNNPIIYDGISMTGKILYPCLYRWMSNFASAFLVKADKVRDEVASVINNKKPVVSVKNGIDFKVFDKAAKYEDIRKDLGISKNEIIIANVAVLNERKGQQHLIDAVCDLRAKYRVHLLIAGEGSIENILKNQIERRNAQNYIHLLGRRNDVNCILANSSIFVLSSYHEGLPNALMEAMAMGLPCIATNVGGVEQLIKNNVNGIVIMPKSTEDIKNAIQQILENPDAALEYGENAYKTIYELYSQDNVAQELLDIYRIYE